MNYHQPELLRALSAEYALGMLTGGARRRFEKLLLDDRSVRGAVAQWEDVLATLALPLGAPRPPERVWKAIQARIGNERSKRASALRRPMWQWLVGGLASAALVVSLVVQLQRNDAPILQAALQGETPATANAIAVAWHGDAIEVQSLAAAPIAADRSLELWVVPAKGKVLSLGVIPVQGKLRVTLTPEQKREFGSHTLLAVTLEPHGGSPTGVATGPIVYKGYLESVRSTS